MRADGAVAAARDPLYSSRRLQDVEHLADSLRHERTGAGTVTVIQRFGSGVQLNVHFHTLVLDGVFSEARPGQLTVPPAPPPGDEEVAQVLATGRARVGRLLARRQLEPEDDSAPPDPLSETSPVPAGLVSASVQRRVALGPRAGARVRRVGDEPELDHVSSRAPRQAQLDGFGLHADLWVPPTDRARLEQLVLLPPPPPARPGPRPAPARRPRPRQAEDGLAPWHLASPVLRQNLVRIAREHPRFVDRS